jgi:hypothetical protein
MTAQTQLQTWTLPQTALTWYAAPHKLETLASSFAPISLKQMDAVALLNRTDTKFVMTTSQLLSALSEIRPDYRMLSITDQRLNHYRTLYFDTPDFALYHDHANGRAERYKVRSREYIDSDLAFLEVKHKTRKDRTIKDRIPTAGQVFQMTPETTRWLHEISPLDGCALEPKLWNTFTRMTLVSRQYCERVTLDIDLTFYTNDKIVRMDGLAIAEVKMDASHGASPFLARMREQRIRPNGFSKYSVGVAMLYDQVKKNAFKAKMLWLEKMMRGNIDHERFC